MLSKPDAKQDIFAAINDERAYQDNKWGVKQHTVGDFLLIMEAELNEAKQAWIKGTNDNEALKEILQVISVGVACLEQHGCIDRWNHKSRPGFGTVTITLKDMTGMDFSYWSKADVLFDESGRCTKFMLDGVQPTGISLADITSATICPCA
jgi:hypothetical protein